MSSSASNYDISSLHAMTHITAIPLVQMRAAIRGKDVALVRAHVHELYIFSTHAKIANSKKIFVFLASQCVLVVWSPLPVQLVLVVVFVLCVRYVLVSLVAVILVMRYLACSHVLVYVLQHYFKVAVERVNFIHELMHRLKAVNLHAIMHHQLHSNRLMARKPFVSALQNVLRIIALA